MLLQIARQSGGVLEVKRPDVSRREQSAVTEEQTLDEERLEAEAIDGDEGPIAMRPGMVDHPRRGLLATPGSPMSHTGAARLRGVAELALESFNGGRTPAKRSSE